MLTFVLAGQSNMQGMGQMAALSDECREALPDVLIFDAAADRWETYDPPRNGLSGMGFGPELGFARAMAAACPGERIGIVKFAVAGSSLLVWSPRWTPEKAAITEMVYFGALYQKLMKLVARARAASPNGPGVAGIFWMQGERDAKFPEAGKDYAPNFRELIESLRGDFGDAALPFIFGRVNPPPDAYHAESAVRKAQEDAPGTIPRSIMVSTDDLPKMADNLHYDTDGLLELGRRFAEAWLEMAAADTAACAAGKDSRNA